MINNVKGALGYNPDFSNTKINTEIPKFYDPTPLNINKLLGETMQETPKNLSYDDILNYVSQKNKSKNFFNDAYFLNKYEYDRFVNSDKDNNSFFNWKKNPIFKDPRYFDNEELNAQNQSGFRQLINGTSKMLPNAINAFVQGLNPLPGVRQGEFANWIKNWSEELEYTHPNYYSKKERDNPFAISSIMDGNFWGDKVLKNAGFTGGAILSAVAWDAGISLATGFTGTAPATAIAFGFALNNIKKKFTTVASVLRSVKGTGMIANASKSAITAYEGLKSYSTGQKALTLAKLGYINYVGSNAEATIEGFEGLTSLNDKFIADFEQKNGRSPLAHEYASMKKIANEMANTRYAINLPLLMITNAIEFGTLFSPSKLLTTGGIGFGERIGVDAAGQLFKRGWKNFSKLEKAGRVLGSSPIKNFLAEGFQEGMQYSIEKATEDLGFKKYANPKFRVGLSEYMESQALGIQKTFSETEGLESMLIGGLTGLITSGGTSSWDKFVSKKSQKEDVILGENIDKYNELTKEGILNSEDFKEYISLAAERDQINFDGTLTHTILDAQMQQAIEDNNAFAFKALQHDKLFNLVSVASKLGKVDAFKIKIDQLKDLSIDEFAQQMGLENLTDEQKEKLSNNIDQYIDVVKDKVDQMSEIVNTVDNSLLNTFDPKKDPINFNAFNELKNTFAYQLSNIDDIKGRMSEEMDDILSSKFNPLSQNMINGLIGEDLEEESLILDDFTKNFVTETGFDLSILDNKYAKAYTAQLNDISTQISLLNSQIETAKAAKLPHSGYASKLAEKKKELTNLTSFLTEFNSKINKFGGVLTLRKDFMHQESIDAYKDLTSHVVKHEMNKDLKNPMSLSKADDLVNAIADLHLLNSSLKLFVDKNNKFQTPKGQAEYIAQYTKWKDYAQNKVQEAVRKSKYETLRRTPEESINQLASEIQTNLSEVKSIKAQIEEIDKQLLDEKTTDEEKELLEKRKDELLKQKQELLDENKELEETKLVIEGKSKEDTQEQNTLNTTNNSESEIVERLSEIILPNLGENLFNNINEKINKTKEELQKINQEVVTNNDLLIYLNNKLEFYLQKINNEQIKIDKQLEKLPNTKYSKKQKQEKHEELISKHKDLLLAAQDIQNRISEIEKTNNIQKQEIEDLEKKIQYYQSILNTEKTHTVELQQKLATTKSSLDKTNRLIEKTESYIDRLKSLLKEIVKAISNRISILNDFLESQGKNTPKLQEDIAKIKTQLLQDNIDGELFVEFNKLEKDVNDVLDHEEINQELLDKAELLLQTQIEKAIKLQNEIRYLSELFQENLNEVKKENTNPNSPQNKKIVEEIKQEVIEEEKPKVIAEEVKPVPTPVTIPTETIITQTPTPEFNPEEETDAPLHGKSRVLKTLGKMGNTLPKDMDFAGGMLQNFYNFMGKFRTFDGNLHKHNLNSFLGHNEYRFVLMVAPNVLYTTPDENGRSEYFTEGTQNPDNIVIVLVDKDNNPVLVDGNYIASKVGKDANKYKSFLNEGKLPDDNQSLVDALEEVKQNKFADLEIESTSAGHYNFIGKKEKFELTKDALPFNVSFKIFTRTELKEEGSDNFNGYTLMPGKLYLQVTNNRKTVMYLDVSLAKMSDIKIKGNPISKNIFDLINHLNTKEESNEYRKNVKDFLNKVFHTYTIGAKGVKIPAIFKVGDNFYKFEVKITDTDASIKIIKDGEVVYELSKEKQDDLSKLQSLFKLFDINDKILFEKEVNIPTIEDGKLRFNYINYTDFIFENTSPTVNYNLDFSMEKPFDFTGGEIYFKTPSNVEETFTQTETTKAEITPTTSNQSEIEAKTDLQQGKVGNTEYEVKVDGVYYQGKKLDNPENKTHRQLIEADIERRRQGELISLLPKDKVSTGNLDFSAAFNIGIPEFYHEFYQQMFDMVKEGKDTIAGVKESNAPLLQKLYNEGKLKDKKDVWLALNPEAVKINAKYDAELKALEQSTKPQVNETTPEISAKKVAVNKLTEKISNLKSRIKNFNYTIRSAKQNGFVDLNDYYSGIKGTEKNAVIKNLTYNNDRSTGYKYIVEKNIGYLTIQVNLGIEDTTHRPGNIFRVEFKIENTNEKEIKQLAEDIYSIFEDIKPVEKESASESIRYRKEVLSILQPFIQIGDVRSERSSSYSLLDLKNEFEDYIKDNSETDALEQQPKSNQFEQAKKADIERRNFLLSKEYKDFGWMSKQEKNDYLELQNSSKDKEDREKAYLKLRELYNKKVDKNFIDKVEKVHWVRNIESLISLLENGKTIPFEISTEGYFNESLKSGWGKGVGVKLKGDTLLASNEDLRSDNKYGSIEDKTFRKYSYGDATSMILNESSFLTHEWLEFEERGKKHQGHNEFLLKNSEIEAIVIDETNSKLTNEFRLEVENLSNRLGIPIIINAKLEQQETTIDEKTLEGFSSEEDLAKTFGTKPLEQNNDNSELTKEVVESVVKPKKNFDFGNDESFLKSAKSLPTIQSLNVTNTDIERVKDIFKGNVNIENLFQIANSDAWATFQQSAITLFKGATRADLYHEAWHHFSQLYLTVPEKKLLYNEIRYKQGDKTFTTFKGEQKTFKEATDLEIEEYIAREFAKFTETGKIEGKFPERKSIFQKIMDFLKSIFSNETDLSLDSLFNNLYKGQINHLAYNTENIMFGKLNSSINDNFNYNDSKLILSGLDALFVQALESKDVSSSQLNEVNTNAVYNAVGKFINNQYQNEQNPIISDNLERVLENWNDIKKFHYNSSTIFNKDRNLYTVNEDGQIVSTDENEDEKKGKNKADFQEASERSVFDILPSEIKNLIFTLVDKDKNGDEIIDPIFGLPKLVDFQRYVQVITQKLSDKTDFKDVEKVLTELSTTYPPMKDLLNSLTINDSNEVKQLRVKFITSMALVKVKLYTILYNEENKDYQAQPVYSNTRRQAESNATSYFSVSPETIFIKKVDGENQIKEISNINYNDDPLPILKSLGIDISFIEYMSEKELDSFLKSLKIRFLVEHLQKYLEKYGVIKDVFKALDTKIDEQDRKSIFTTIVRADLAFNPEYISATSLNAENKLESENVLWSTITKDFQTIQNAKSISELNQNPNKVHYNPTAVDMDSSVLLNLMFDEKGNRTKFTLSVDNYNGINSGKQGEIGIKTKDTFYIEKALMDINQFINNNILTTMQLSNKATYLGFKLSNKLFSDKQEFAQIMLKYLFSELDIIQKFDSGDKELTKLVKLSKAIGTKGNYNFAIFKEIITNNHQEIINEYLETGNLSNETKENALQQINDFFTKELKLHSNFLGEEIGGINPSSGSKYAKSTNKEDLLDDYIKNQFVFNVELSKITFGNPYMHKDPYKRIAGATSTGTRLLVDDLTLQDFESSTKETQRSSVMPLLLERLKLKEYNLKNQRSSNKELRFIAFKDREMLSQYYGELLDVVDLELSKHKINSPEYNAILEKKISIQKAYSKVNGSDAMGAVTMDAWRKFNWLAGRWTTELEKIYEKTIKWDYHNRLLKSSKTEEEKIKQLALRNENAIDEAEKLTISVMKYQYYGNVKNSTIMEKAFHKYQLMPLIPQLIDGKLYEQHLDRMLMEDVDYLLFDSADKLEKTKTPEEFYKNKEQDDVFVLEDFVSTYEKGNTSYNVRTGFLENLKEQVFMENGTDNSLLFGTQIRALLFNTDSFSDLYDEFRDVIGQLTQIEKDKLYKKASLNEKGEVIDKSKFVQFLLDELDKKVVNYNVKEYLRLTKEGEFAGSLDTNLQRTPIESIINSVIQNKIVKQKMHGEMMVQVSNVGFETFGKKDSLKFYGFEQDGKVRKMEVKVPLSGKFKNLLNLVIDGRKVETRERLNQLIKEGKIDQRSLTMVGYRIPTQEHNSVEVMIVQEFLDPISNLIVVPYEITAKAGSDFDIDKLNIFKPHIDENGNYITSVEKPTDLDYTNLSEIKEKINSKKETVQKSWEIQSNKLQKLYDERLANKEEVSDNIEDLRYSLRETNIEIAFLKEDILILKELNQDDKSMSNLLITMFSDDAIKNRSIEELIKEKEDKILQYNNDNKLRDELIKTFKGLSSKSLEEIARVEKRKQAQEKYLSELNDLFIDLNNISYKIKNYKASKQNRIIEIFEKVLLDPNNFINLITPNSTSLFDEAINNVFKIKYSETERQEKKGVIMPNDIVHTNSLLPRNSWDMHRVFGDSGKGLGIAAVGNKFSQLIQKAKVNFTEEYLEKYNLRFKIDNLSNRNFQNGESKATAFSQLINLLVDVANDPRVGYVNMGDEVIPIVNLMINFGIDIEQIIYLINQPIIVDYIKYSSKNSKRLIKGKNDKSSFSSYLSTKALNAKSPLLSIDDNYEIKKDMSATEIAEKLMDVSLENNKENIGFKISKLNAEEQLLLLSQFAQFEEMSKDFLELQMTMNFDTNTVQDGFEAFQKEELFKEIKGRDTFTNLDDLKYKTVISPLNVLQEVVNINAQLLPLANSKLIYNFLSSKLSGNFQLNSNKNKARFIRTFKNDYIMYLFQNFLGRSEKALLNFNTTFAPVLKVNEQDFTNKPNEFGIHLIKNLYKEFAEIKNNPNNKDLFNQYLLLDRLFVTTEKEFKNIGLSYYNKDSELQNTYIEQFKELLNSPNLEIRNFMLKFAYMGFYQSGLNKSLISSTDVLPIKILSPILENIREQYLSEINDNRKTLYTLDDFYKLMYDNNEFMRSNKEMKIEMVVLIHYR
jgi:hypothetical protein